MQYISTNPPKNDCWTILVLVPAAPSSMIHPSSLARERSCPQSFGNDTSALLDDAIGAPNTRLLKMLNFIYCFHKMAYNSWDRLGDHLELLLSAEKTSTLFNKRVGDDDVVNDSLDFFWIINKVDEILPIITDAIDQWEWFWAANKPLSTQDDEIWLPWMEEVYVEEPVREGLAEKIKEIENFQKGFHDCYERFEGIRGRALSLREGVSTFYAFPILKEKLSMHDLTRYTTQIFNLTSVKEAIEARHLGENVKLLTYVTIFYLPPAYCAVRFVFFTVPLSFRPHFPFLLRFYKLLTNIAIQSLWGINSWFNTGTTGFAIASVVISLVTYLIVAGLLHFTGRKKVLKLWEKFQSSKEKQKVKMKKVKIERGEEKVSGLRNWLSWKGRGKKRGGGESSDREAGTG